MTNKVALISLIFLCSCAAENIADGFVEIDERVSYDMLCGPTGEENTTLHVGTIFLDDSVMVDAALLDTSERSYLINMIYEDNGDVEGAISLPYFNCADGLDVIFLSEY